MKWVRGGEYIAVMTRMVTMKEAQKYVPKISQDPLQTSLKDGDHDAKIAAI